MNFEMTIKEEDYIIEILSFTPEQICKRGGHPDTWWPDEPAEVEFQVLTLDGEVVDIANWSKDELDDIEERAIIYATEEESYYKDEADVAYYRGRGEYDD